MRESIRLIGAGILAATSFAALAQNAPAPEGDAKARAIAKAAADAEPAVANPAPPPASPPPAAAPAPAAPPGKPSPAKAGGDRGQKASDRIDLETTQITGNRELPKVMVVVPWKRSDIGDLVGRPVNSLVDEALQPVDREVFRREIDYYGALSPDRPRGETHVTGAAVKERPEK